MPFPPRARVYLWSMALAGLGTLAFWVWMWHGPAPTNVGLVLFLAALAAFAQHFPLPIGPRHKVDASSAVYFAALLLFGMPVAVGLVGVSQLAGGATLALRRNPVSGKRMRTPRSVVFNAGQLMLATGLAGWVYYHFLPQSAPAPLEHRRHHGLGNEPATAARRRCAGSTECPRGTGRSDQSDRARSKRAGRGRPPSRPCSPRGRAP